MAWRYAGVMRYPDGSGLTAAERPTASSRARTGILRFVRVRGYEVDDLRDGAAAD